MNRLRGRAGAAAALAAALGTLAPLGGASGQASGGLHVLLTGGDGYAAPGVASMRDALRAAGHRVTVVAPVDDMSGSGSGITTSGLIDYYPQAEGVWAVDGTPADAVTLAMVHVLRDDPPDLVLAGLGFGESVGANLPTSGTVGAALTASRLGIPAIAASVAANLDEAEAEPSFPSTRQAFGPAADLVVELVRQLHETDAEGLLPPRAVLNVNYPAVGAGDVAGVRFATVAGVRSTRQVFAVAGDQGPARVETIPGNPERAEGGSDYDLLADGYVTISVLDGNLDAGRGSWDALLERLVIER